MARKQYQPVGKAEDVAKREQDVFDMHRQGWSLRAIAAQVKVSHEQVRKDIAAVMAVVQAEKKASADEYIALENERYDRWMRALSTQADYGDVPSILAGLKVSEARRRLNGWDAPTRVAHEGKDGGAIAHTVIQREETPEEAFARLTDPVAREAYIERISAVHSAQQHLIELQRQLGLPDQSTAAQVDAGAPPD